MTEPAEPSLPMTEELSSGAHSSVEMPPISERCTMPSNMGYTADIEREVAEAMAGMSAEELMELSANALLSSTALPADERDSLCLRRATIVGIHGEDVFLDLGGKTHAVVPRSQFNDEDPVQKGRIVEVALVRYEPSDGLWVASRDGAVREATWDTLRVGVLVEGRVTGLNKGGLELNLKGIRGFMPSSHVDPRHLKDISVFLNQVVQCEVLEVNRKEKNVLVSRRKYVERQQRQERERVRTELAAGQVRKGVVSNVTEFGAFVDLGGGLDGLIHIRELAWTQVDKVTDWVQVGQAVEVVVLKVDHEHKRISLSLRQNTPDPWSCVGDKYPEGTQLKARILRLAEFGAFAELEAGIEALIPISEISWTGRLRHPKEVLEVGQMVDAVVLRAEPENHRLALSMKKATTDPWEGVFDSFPKGSVVTGMVMRLTDFGAFVQLTPGVEGLVHISEISPERIKSCSDVLQIGQEVRARVLNVDRAQRRISLSIRGAEERVAPPEADSGELSEAAKAKPSKKKREKPLRGGLAASWDWQGLTLGR